MTKLTLVLAIGLLSVAVVPAEAVARAVAPVPGVFSIHCAFSHANFDDAIVHPGEVGATHEHAYAGGRDANANSTVASMDAGASSCPLHFDTAGYWFPMLTSPAGVPCNAALGGTYEPPNPASLTAPLGQCVYRPNLVNVYYRATRVAPATAFPQDLRMVVGGDTLAPPNAGGIQGSLSYSCSDVGPYFPAPPFCPKKSGALQMHIHFPDCLSPNSPLGSDATPTMTYSVGKLPCPAGYVQLPRLSIHVRYAPGTGGAGWGLTSDYMRGMSNGQSLHADFWNTWDQPVLEGLVTRCLNGGLSCKGVTDANYLTVGT